MVDILLLGAQGQLGWEVARRAPEAGLTVTALARDGLDITDRAACFETVARHEPRVVVNATAYNKVDKAEEEPEAATAGNADGPENLALAAHENGAALVHVSTDYVFDGTASTPYREEDPVSPLGSYGRSKLDGERRVASACPRHVILRTAWVHGVHGGNFVKTMLRLASERDRLRVVDDQRGSPTFAGDLAAAILAMVPRLAAAPEGDPAFGLFHCTGSGEVTWCGFARAIVERSAPVTGRSVPVDAITTAEFPTPAKRPAYSVLDCAKLAEVHGLEMPHWSDGLDRMLNEHLPERVKS